VRKNGQLEYVTPIEASSPVKIIKNKTPSHMLRMMVYSTQHPQHTLATIFSTAGKFQPVSNFTELHALTQASVLMHSWST